MVVEKQVIVSWYRPCEKLPPEEWDEVLCTISGRGKNVIYDHVIVLMGYDKSIGWFCPIDNGLEDFVVHAWCDLEPYKGE